MTSIERHSDHEKGNKKDTMPESNIINSNSKLTEEKNIVSQKFYIEKIY